MRWCAELGIEVSWNVLAGFPGEDPAEYAEMAALMARLTHLDPPCACGMLRLDRFSPFHTRVAELGMTRIRPAQAYFYVYPLGRRQLLRLAYFFDHDHADGRDPQAYMTAVQDAVVHWKNAKFDPQGVPPRLDAHVAPDGEVRIEDTRPAVATASEHRLTGLAAKVYSACDSAATVEGLAKAFDVDEGRIEAVLATLDRDALIARKDNRALALAVFRTRADALAARYDVVPQAATA